MVATLPTPRTALVTGGTGGIGRAVALRLAREGMRVTCVYKNNERAREACAALFSEAAGEAAGGAAGGGLEARFERADLSVAGEVSALFDRLAQAGREPELLINAAGMTRDAPLAFLSAADFDAVLAANLKSTFLVCQQAVKAMVRRRFGRIVNFSSPAALLGNEGQTAYAAAKAGVLGLSRSLAREVGRFGITVNTVSPGLVRTELTEGLTAQRLERLIARTPLGRTATADEVAGMVWMLSQDRAAALTGQCFAIDGGLS